MRSLVTFICALGSLLTVTTAAPATVEDLLWEMSIVPRDGERAADFTLEDLDGKRVSLGEYRGRVVLLYFWSTT